MSRATRASTSTSVIERRLEKRWSLCWRKWETQLQRTAKMAKVLHAFFSFYQQGQPLGVHWSKMPKAKAEARKIFPDLILFQQRYSRTSDVHKSIYTDGMHTDEQTGRFHCEAVPCNFCLIPSPKRSTQRLEETKRHSHIPGEEDDQGTTSQSASLWSLGRWWKALSGNHFWHVKEKIIRSSQHKFIKVKSCLTSLISFYNEMCSLTEEQWILFYWTSGRPEVLYRIHKDKLLKYKLDENSKVCRKLAEQLDPEGSGQW